MEQGKASEKVVEGGKGATSASSEAGTLATHRQCSLLANYLNAKYSNPVHGRHVNHELARWSKQQLQQSLKAA
jgi:hypothetical protein